MDIRQSTVLAILFIALANLIPLLNPDFAFGFAVMAYTWIFTAFTLWFKREMKKQFDAAGWIA